MSELFMGGSAWWIVPVSLGVFGATFGLLPGLMLRLLVLLYPRGDPRRQELFAELYAPGMGRIRRFEWVFQQLETASREGLATRRDVRRARKQMERNRRQRVKALNRAASAVKKRPAHMDLSPGNILIRNAGTERREATLVGRYADWLAWHGQETARLAIHLPGHRQAIYTDMYNTTSCELIEAKCASTQEQVRLAIGQIRAYARYVAHARRAILLPVRPADDLVELLMKHGIACIYEVSTAIFDRVDPE